MLGIYSNPDLIPGRFRGKITNRRPRIHAPADSPVYFIIYGNAAAAAGRGTQPRLRHNVNEAAGRSPEPDGGEAQTPSRSDDPRAIT